MQSRQFWDEINDSCKVGSSYIKRIIDLERVPFNANLVFPDSNPEIIKSPRRVVSDCNSIPKTSLKSVSPLFPPNPSSFKKKASIS